MTDNLDFIDKVKTDLKYTIVIREYSYDHDQYRQWLYGTYGPSLCSSCNHDDCDCGSFNYEEFLKYFEYLINRCFNKRFFPEKTTKELYKMAFDNIILDWDDELYHDHGHDGTWAVKYIKKVGYDLTVDRYYFKTKEQLVAFRMYLPDKVDILTENDVYNILNPSTVKPTLKRKITNKLKRMIDKLAFNFKKLIDKV